MLQPAKTGCSRFILFGIVLTIALFALTGCGKKPQLEEGFIRLSTSDAEEVAKEMDISIQKASSWLAMAPAIEKSIAYVSRKDPARSALHKYNLTITWGELRASLLLLKNLLPQLDENPELLAKHFAFFELAPGPKFTSYYEPAIEASLTPSAEYSYPIYGVPEDLKSVDLGQFHPRWKGERLTYRIVNGELKPYFDRSEIDTEGALRERSIEIAWAKDPIDIFFLQIQGSGRLILEDGTEKHVLYAGKNGKQYVSLGRIMKERGLLAPDGISMQSIRAYLDQNPHKLRELLDTNPSYVFFRLSDSGPYGAINQPLTPRISLATDPNVIPLGSPLLFTVPLPEKDEQGAFTLGESFTGFGLAQDTGGAIQEHRIDFFSGYGEEATWIAGHLNAPGKVWILLPRAN